LIWPERLISDKHSSLLQTTKHYGPKKLQNVRLSFRAVARFEPTTTRYEFESSSTVLRPGAEPAKDRNRQNVCRPNGFRRKGAERLVHHFRYQRGLLSMTMDDENEEG